MSGDNAGKTAETHVDIWYLPKILKVHVERARFDPPRLRVRQGKPEHVTEATALVVETDGSIPVRAAAAVLFVGDTRLTESERVGKNHYRFYAFKEDQLREGAPIGLGWTGIDHPLETTKFLFNASAHDPGDILRMK
jgi:hypothetical protein